MNINLWLIWIAIMVLFFMIGFIHAKLKERIDALYLFLNNRVDNSEFKELIKEVMRLNEKIIRYETETAIGSHLDKIGEKFEATRKLKSDNGEIIEMTDHEFRMLIKEKMKSRKD